MKKRTKEILWYLGLSFSFALLFCLPAILFPRVTTPLRTFLHVLAAWSPAFSVFILRKWIIRRGFKHLGLDFNFKKNWIIYLCALLFPIVVVPVAVVTALFTGASLETSSLGSIEFQASLLAGSLVQVLLAFPMELGWRGYLQPRLDPERPLRSALLTGLLWGAWSIPLLLAREDFSAGLPGLALNLLNFALFSVFLGWLRSRAHSTWPPALANALWVGLVLPVISSLLPGTPQWLTWGLFPLVGVMVLALVLVFTRQVPWRFPRHRDD